MYRRLSLDLLKLCLYHLLLCGRSYRKYRDGHNETVPYKPKSQCKFELKSLVYLELVKFNGKYLIKTFEQKYLIDSFEYHIQIGVWKFTWISNVLFIWEY